MYNHQKHYMIRIGDNIINVSDINVQLTIMKHATIYVELDISKYPEYYDYFIEKYENKNIFTISSRNFVGMGCRIKTLDIEFKVKMNLTIVCDLLDPDIIDRRDILIEQLLNDK